MAALCEAKELLFRGQELVDEEVELLATLLQKLKVQELKTLAKEVHVRLTGSIRKDDIIDRIMGMARIGALQCGNPESDDITTISYLTEETKCVLRSLPSFASVTWWEKKLSGILMEFTLMNLVVYLVYGRDKTFDMQSMNAYRQLKAFKFFYDGFVKNVWLYQCPVSNDLNLRVLYFRAYVYHSLSCETPLEVYVAVNGDNGDVYAGKCSCVSGLGQACNHIAALLFFIDYHANDEELPSELSKTSQPMAWHQPPKKIVSPECARNMKFVKPSHGDTPRSETQGVSEIKRSSFDPRLPEHRIEIDQNHLHLLLTDLQNSVPNTGLQQFWRDSPNPRCLQPAAEINNPSLWNHVLFSHKTWNSETHAVQVDPSVVDCHRFISSMQLSNSQVEAIEAATRTQSDSELWIVLHNGRLTSSRFGEILKRRAATDPTRLVIDIMGYNGPMEHIPPAMRWGKENEAKARQCYLENRQSIGEDMIVQPTGLHLLPDKSFLGASSDGKILCRSTDTCCYGCLEIKCPYSIKSTITIELTPTEIAEQFPAFFMKKGSDGLLHLPTNHGYYAQVQGEMAILGVEWCDFIVYSNGVVVVDRILADADYWKNLEEKLEQFYLYHVVPELLSRCMFLEKFGVTA